MGPFGDNAHHGHGPEPMARGARVGRIVERLGSRGGGPSGGRRPWFRYRRLHPSARRLLRHHRPQADLRPGEPCRRRWRSPGRTTIVGPMARTVARLRAHAPGHGRSGIPLDPTASAHPVPDYLADLDAPLGGLRVGGAAELLLPGPRPGDGGRGPRGGRAPRHAGGARRGDPAAGSAGAERRDRHHLPQRVERAARRAPPRPAAGAGRLHPRPAGAGPGGARLRLPAGPAPARPSGPRLHPRRVERGRTCSRCR